MTGRRITLQGVDVVALVSVASSAGVAISVKAFDAWSKRGDRKHESALEYDKRAWDTKSAALTAVIAICLDISEKSELRPTSPNVDPENNRRSLTIRALDRAHDRLDEENVTGAVVALSTDATRRHFQRLLATITAERKDHDQELSEISRMHESVDDVLKEMGTLGLGRREDDNEPWELIKTLIKRSAEAEDRMVAKCDLDIDALKAVCESVIAEARKDLRGERD